MYVVVVVVFVESILESTFCTVHVNPHTTLKREKKNVESHSYRWDECTERVLWTMLDKRSEAFDPNKKGWMKVKERRFYSKARAPVIKKERVLVTSILLKIKF